MNASVRRAIVIGGSLAGLFAGLLLRRQFAVDIYERADAELAGRGAGIVTHELLGEALDAAGIGWRQGLGVEVETRRFFDRDGRLKLEYPYRQTLTAWDRLYDMLRRAFPAAHYRGGKELVAVEEYAGSVAARFADGSVAEGDVLIGADGLRSTVRAQFLPDATPIYAGYVAWRALVPEQAIAPDLHAQVFDHLSFCLPPGEQILGYPVAGPDNELRPGGRRYNLVWYRPADEIELKRLLTDEGGTLHALSIPPPLVSRTVIADMREAAETVLAAQFRDLIRLVDRPILQAIYDLESPRMAFGRVALIGDAAFVARPHVGAGVVKAAQDALALMRALESTDDIAAALKAMEAAQVPFGRRIVARARALGASLQPRQATAEERANAARFRAAEATLRETATLEFLQ
ncbi:MAG TPA: FAD-dependent monooxygenase [Xanthobacteraceae bacterium]|jgi:2-polyprenyl-6-methoxyphenol hydroxylase-like FAD-dependent oxidoreductase|nr:FAD-dependent monooxygenase [Xanthobacteraceae bacterium]